MITTYHDKSCKALKSSQNLKLTDNCSALWFCVEKGSDPSSFLKFMVLILNSFIGFFWLASFGGSGSSKMLELKRSFGHWKIPKTDIVSRHDSLDESGNKLYSDVAQITDANIDTLASMLNRNLFGIDSAVFFLPDGASLNSKNVAKPLVDLLIKRNALKEIDERLLNQGWLESFIAEILSLGGIATITLRDSNMNIMVVAVGDQYTLSRLSKLLEDSTLAADWKHIVNEAEFGRILNVGVSVSAFS